MTFEEWFHKEYEPADLQIKQYAENKEGLHIPATVYLEDLKKAFEAGQEGKVVEYFEAYGQCRDSRRIAELEKENERLTDELKALRESIKDYGAGCYENGLRNGRRKLEEQIEKMKCCENCNNFMHRIDHRCNTKCKNLSEWEIKEK